MVGNVGGNVTGLGFDDRQGGQRTGAQFIVQLGGAFQQAGVVVENIARDTPRVPADVSEAEKPGDRPPPVWTDRHK